MNQPLRNIKIKKFSLKYAIFVVCIVVLVTLVYLFFPLKSYVIITRSMEPVLNVRDFVFVNRYHPADHLEEGDIIAFFVDFDDSGTKDVVVHYVHSINQEANEALTIFTISERSNVRDQWEIPESDYIGKYVNKVPMIGSFILFLVSPIGMFILLVDIVIIYFIMYYWKFGRELDGKENKDNVDNEEKDRKQIDIEQA